MIESAFMGLALALGFKHSYDADHLLAVSSTLRKASSMKSAVKSGFSWALGHMITAALVAVLLFYFGDSILGSVLPHFEKIAGIMLIALGLFSLKDFLRIHSHEHSHGKITHSHPHMHSKSNHAHRHMFGIGIVHGLASNDEILILLIASLGVTTIGTLLAGIGFFSVGVILGMILFSAFFAYPVIKANSEKIFKILSFAIGASSMIYGTLILI